MDFVTYLKTEATDIDKTLAEFLSEFRAETTRTSEKLVSLVDVFIKSCEGGKRLRGVLVKLGYQLVASTPNHDINKPASAIEVFQTAILAHDDIIDLSDLRRGNPTIYKALGGNHYGISQAICLGDVGLFLGTQLIAESNFDPKYITKCLSLFSKMIVDTALGEMLDVELPYLKEDRKEEDVLAIHKYKTAYYTIVYPLSLGAILAGGSEEMIKNITIFGENLGIAFQIQDDILGVFGQEKEIGKSVTSDIEEGKNTLLITYALENVTPEQREILDKYYGKGKIDEQSLAKIRDIFRDTGALNYSKERAKEYVDAAKKIIPSLTEDPSQRQLLSEMSDFLVERDK